MKLIEAVHITSKTSSIALCIETAARQEILCNELLAKAASPQEHKTTTQVQAQQAIQAAQQPSELCIKPQPSQKSEANHETES